MFQFYEMKITEVFKTTRDAIVLSLDAERSFDFIPGQYLTFRKILSGKDIRRSYSICSGKNDEFLQVAIKRVEGGIFSNWANTELRPGDILESMVPMGNFYSKPLESNVNSLAFAGGSGITPIISILKTELRKSTESKFTLVYSNHHSNTMMFREELGDLKNLYMNRLNLVHIFTGESQEHGLFSGRLTNQKLKQLFKYLININNVTSTYICGPDTMMLEITDALVDQGMEKKLIRREYFKSEQEIEPSLAQPQRRKLEKINDGVRLKVTLDGRIQTFDSNANISLLQAALEHNIEAPYACRAGVCSTCKAKILEGEVEMLSNNALEDHEVERGFVLTCQAYPKSDEVTWDYDLSFE